MVLSKPENGIGEQVYKPVVKTVVTQGQDVYQICYVTKAVEDEAIRTKTNIKEESMSYLVTTENHPFWEVSRVHDWIPAWQLMTGDEFVLVDGQIGVVFSDDGNGVAAQAIIRTVTDGIGWVQTGLEKGYLTDLRDNQVNGSFSEQRVLNDEVEWWRDDVDNKIKRTVYNIEVADTHTYYVGELGVWVHNMNCDIELVQHF